MNKISNWFNWLLYWVGWSKHYFEFYSFQLANNSYLKTNSQCNLRITNVNSLAKYTIHLSSYNNKTFLIPMEVEEKFHLENGIESITLTWKIPPNLPVSLYYIECHSQNQVHWKSNAFIILDYEFEWLNAELLELGHEKEWPYSVEVKCRITFPNEIEFPTHITNRFGRKVSTTIEVNNFNSAFQFLNRINPFHRTIVHPANQKTTEINLKYHLKDGIFSGANFMWEFWFNFGNNYQCRLFCAGPFKPVTTIDTITNSSIVKMLTGYNEDLQAEKVK